MIEQLTNNVAEWGGLNVDGFANLLLVLFALVVVLEVGIALYDRTKGGKRALDARNRGKGYKPHLPNGNVLKIPPNLKGASHRGPFYGVLK